MPELTRRGVMKAYEAAGRNIPRLPEGMSQTEAALKIYAVAREACSHEEEEKRGFAAARDVFSAAGYDPRDAASLAHSVSEEKRRPAKATPVLISILILFAAYLISNWSTYSSIISSYFLVR